MKISTNTCLTLRKKLTTDKNVRISYERKNNNMGVIGEMRAQMNELRGMMKQVLENKKSQERVGNVAAPVEGISMDDPAVVALFKGFTKYLQDEGYISKRPLNQRNVANYNAALTPDELPASISGPVTALFGLRQLRDKISANNFVANLPAFSSCACAAGGNIAAGTANNTWSVNDVAIINNEYKKLSDTISELKSLMASLQI